MALITACPHCQTRFEVTEAELQMHDGKVRCGECSQVFDGRANLVQLSEPADAQSATETADALAVEPDSASAELTASIDAPATEPDIPEFLRSVSAADSPPKPPLSLTAKIGYSLTCALLLCLLLAQCLYVWRNEIAVRYPQSKPWLQRACQSLHCQLSLPQDITQLAIDDTDVQEHPQRQGVLVFTGVISNHADTVQAWPSIVLSLTNTADEVLYRKLLRPVDYLPKPATAATGIAARQSLHVQALLAIEDNAITGFRVSIEYP